MSDLVCEKIARKAGFAVSVGNWIAPDGTLISGTNYKTHHWETIQEYLGKKIQTDNQLQYINNLVDSGFIRLIFRADVCFHIGALNIEDIWSNNTNYTVMIKMLSLISNIEDIDVHIFNQFFYVIGSAKDIVEKNLAKLQIKDLRKSHEDI